MTLAENATPRTTRRARGQVGAIVLAQLAAVPRPRTAYEIIDSAASAGELLSPAQVYRALDQLIAHGQVDRVESLSAYVVRHGPPVVYLLCGTCDVIRTLALPEVVDRLLQHARVRGFDPKRLVLEQRSLCAECRLASSADR